MKIKDKVYGEEEIKEQVLIELINSESIQRLKGVAQWGMPNEYYHKKGFSRYEHSIGVLILLKRFNVGLNEQIAGLLHDISHSSFSHVVDWLLGDPTKEDYQDKIHNEIIKNSEIPKILEKYGINHNKISNIENFSLLEKEAPSLCVDRLEYTLRELEKEGNSKVLKKILSNLTNNKGQIVFTDIKFAEIFGREYSRLQREHWAGDEARARYYILSNILRRSIKRKIISINDLRKTDNEVINLLINSNDDIILKGLNLLKEGFVIKKSEEGIELKKKFRYVDPEVLVERGVRRLSEMSQKYKKFLDREKEDAKNYSRIIII